MGNLVSFASKEKALLEGKTTISNRDERVTTYNVALRCSHVVHHGGQRHTGHLHARRRHQWAIHLQNSATTGV